jgi:hypothetical protein
MKYEKPTQEFITDLRNGFGKILFDRKTKLFHHIQLNKKAKHICWQRHVSNDKRNWVEWNYSLSLREVLDLRAEIAIHCQEMCFKVA